MYFGEIDANSCLFDWLNMAQESKLIIYILS